MTTEPASGSVAPAARTRANTGILPMQSLRGLVAEGVIASTGAPIGDAQLQPASLDLRLGPVAYRVRASFLPGRQATVREKIDAFGMHQVDLSAGAVLERGCVYVVPLQETLALPPRLSGIANPKSSSGRLDIFTRLIADHAVAFDRIEAGYQGPLYAEIAPRTFSILVRQGGRLNQLRLRQGRYVYSDTALKRLHREVALVHSEEGIARFAGGVVLSVDLTAREPGALIGWKARHHTPLIDIERVGHYDPLEFWEPLHDRRGEGLILNPDDFYILASREAVTIPPDHAAEMVAYDTLVGEFRVHYAGFFDPGFGFAAAGGAGTRAVLEIRSHDVPFLLEHGQIIGRLVYERLSEAPEKLYGRALGSNYQQQGLALSKQFRRPEPGTAPLP